MTLITIIGRGHSGTRAISNTLAASGVYMGEPLNKSWDLIPAEDMYDACRIFGQYVRWNGGLDWNWDDILSMDIPKEFKAKLFTFLETVLTKDAPLKGWKIPETTLCFPWISRIFPDAKYIFWIRNPRDCILGRHCTDDMTRFGISYPQCDDDRLRRAYSWRYQYDLVKATPRPKNWIEVRLEDFVLKQEETLQRLEEFLGIKLARILVKPEAVGRWKVDDEDPTTGPNYFDIFEPAMHEYGYEIPESP